MVKRRYVSRLFNLKVTLRGSFSLPDSAGEHAAVEGAMMLYSLGWTLEQVQERLCA